MSSKKKRKFLNVMLSALMLLGAGATQSYAETGINGVAYVLLSNDTSYPGVWRFNDYNGKKTSPWKLIKTSDLSYKDGKAVGKVSGLAVNQENKVFLCRANIKSNDDGDFEPASPGWLPTGIKFSDDSAVYIAAAKPSEGGATHYIRSGCPHISNSSAKTGSYWKHDQKIGSYGPYKYVVTFGGPTGVRYFNGSNGTIGTPVWDGSYVAGGTSTGGAMKHPTDERKIILPSHFGALSYYLYGTKNEAAITGKCMDGRLEKDGVTRRDTYIFTQANGAGVFGGDTKHKARSMFGCIVKRFYDLRKNSLDLYSRIDPTKASNPKPSDLSMGLDSSGVLETIDVKIREAYGKICGDNCIDGGAIYGGDVDTALSTVTVVTTTKGYRYGYNPLGKIYNGNGIEAALRYVNEKGAGEGKIDISSNEAGTSWGSRITNKSYLNSNGIKPSTVTCIGVSSNFSGNDYVYASGADSFVVQDSWWGLGGVAYEYYKKDGSVRKIDYMNKSDQTGYDKLEGTMKGEVDAIGVDGDANLYSLLTVESPTDKEMRSTLPAASPSSPYFIDKDKNYWRRDKYRTVGSEVINDGWEWIPNGQEKEKDYKVATISQAVYKQVNKYPLTTGQKQLNNPQEVGKIRAGNDYWTNNLIKTSSGYKWGFNEWQQNPVKVSDVKGELAVVNIADHPTNIDGTTNHYVVVTARNGVALKAPVNVIAENENLTFKVEGYKPKVPAYGTQRTFKSVGTAGSLSGVAINNIPGLENNNNRYEHDEDNDGRRSGFPSSMFEASGYPTQVTWTIARVEDTVCPDRISNAKVITTYPKKVILSSSNSLCALTYTFKDPGRYLIQGSMDYYYFTNYTTAARPADLKFARKYSVHISPILISVYANNLNLNHGTSFITNIKISKSNKYGKYNRSSYKPSLPSSDGVYSGSKDDFNNDNSFDTAEGETIGEKNNKKNELGDTLDKYCQSFGDLDISFNAQFVREINYDETTNYNTNDGIGVWDYDYYRTLYIHARDHGLQTIDPLTVVRHPAPGQHVYNYKKSVTGRYNNITSIYDPNIYNPGKAKETATGGGTYKAGTEVGVVSGKDPLKDIDKAFIQWALYLRPLNAQSPTPSNSPMFQRGTLIANGTCATATFTLINTTDRIYKVNFPIKDIDSKIMVPRDPKNYYLDLEIIYPRVTWLNNTLGVSGSNKYFSSMVPWVDSNSSPIHVLSMVDLKSGLERDDYTIQQMYSGVYAPKEVPYMTLNVRDCLRPEFQDNSTGLPYLETTGDPIIPQGVFKYQIKDNNPFMQFSNIAVLPQDITPITTKIAESSNGLNLHLQRAGSSFKADDIYYDKGTVSKYNTDIYHSSKVDGSDRGAERDPGFFASDTYRLFVKYNNTINNLSDFTVQSTKYLSIEDMKKKSNYILRDNWIGTLNYTVTGWVYDGLGIDAKGLGYYSDGTRHEPTNVVHVLYDSDVATKKVKGSSANVYGLTSAPKSQIQTTNAPYLRKIDNDPPSIGVTLISQTDNRRWNYQLIEGIADRAAAAPNNVPSTVDQLATSLLTVNGYKLQDNSTVASYKTNVKGSTNNYLDKSTHTIINKLLGNPQVKAPNSGENLASFKHSSRLIINVDIFDNCGFKDLKEATITVTDVQNNETLLAPSNINCIASHNDYGTIIKFDEEPRGTFAVDLPMKIATKQPQVEVSVKAKDHAGNEKELVIPVSIVENTFDIRVLETKEHKDN